MRHRRRAGYRIFGAKPGSYGAGILPLIEEKNWQADADFAEAYVNWGGYAYARRRKAWTHATRSAVGCRAYKWRCTTRTIASTTFSTATTTCNSTAA